MYISKTIFFALFLSFMFINPVTADLSVHFLDVFGGDAVLLEQDGHTMLIDSGTKDSGNLTRLYLKNLNIESLDSVMITNQDEGRIGAMTNILNATPASEFYMGQWNTTGGAYQDILNKLEEDQTPVTCVAPGDHVLFTDDVTIDILTPVTNTKDVMPDILVPLITYGDIKFLLMGSKPDLYGVPSRSVRTTRAPLFSRFEIVDCAGFPPE